MFFDPAHATAEWALRTIKGASHPDGLSLEVRLPGMGGWELAGRERRICRSCYLVVTACDHEREVRDASDLRGEAFIPSPFSIDVLRAVVPGHLQAHGPGFRTSIR
jgi:DNA-binding response OmpR family regulator